MKKHETILREHDLKVTPQRLGILSILDKSGHSSIEELFAMIRKDFSSISVATLYKNINTLQEANILKEVKVPNAKSKYEILKGEHSHMLCKKCGRVEDITLDLHGLMEEASKQSGYLFDESALVLSGTCPKCQAR